MKFKEYLTDYLTEEKDEKIINKIKDLIKKANVKHKKIVYDDYTKDYKIYFEKGEYGSVTDLQKAKKLLKKNFKNFDEKEDRKNWYVIIVVS